MWKTRKTTLSPELIEKARLELNEDPSAVQDQIESFREKILEDHNRNFRTDDAFLLRFLRARKFDRERALELIINYYKQREYYPDLFRKPKSEVEELLSLQLSGALQNRDSEGRAVNYFSCRNWDVSRVGMEDLVRIFLMTLEVLIEDEAVQVNGIVWVFDLQGMELAHITQFTPWKMKEAVSVMMSSFPIRCKAIHHVNESAIFDSAYAVIRPFLSKKLQDRVMFHGDCLAALHECLDPEILPEELGGDLDPVDHNQWNQILLDRYQEFVEDSQKYGFVNSVSQGKENVSDP